MAVSVGPESAPKGGLGGPVPGDPDHAELNLRILQSLAQWLRETVGAEALEEVAKAGDVQVEDLEGGSVWVSWPRFESILAAAAKHTASEAEFRDACAYRIGESYGPLRLLLKAWTPERVFTQAAKSFPTISAISETEVTVQSRTRLRFVYRSKRPESRHMCLSRQGQAVFLPTLWGLPRATLMEKRCIAWGDDACEYDIRWNASRRWLPIIGAALGGGLAWTGLAFAGLDVAGWMGSFAVVSLGVFTYALEQRKANAENIAFAQDAQAALGKLAAEEEEIRRELVALEGRQRDWLRRVEHELEARTLELREMEARVEGLHERRFHAMRGQVHDLRNMLAVVWNAFDVVASHPDGTLAEEAMRDAEAALKNVDALLRRAMTGSAAGRALVMVEARQVDVIRLTDSLRRRVSAFTYGDHVRVDVRRRPEAPDVVTTDPLLVDRILDNLLVNAAKVTRIGHVRVVVGGQEGFLTIEISDTGRGIGPERMREVFLPGVSGGESAGFGVGLSVVVQLLAQLGGRLEVMSRVGVGTTFWVYVPVELEAPSVTGNAAVEELVSQVVRIRAVG